MDVLFLLIPVSVLLVFAIGIIFWWTIKHGQFEDLDGPAYRIIMDDDAPDVPKDQSDAIERHTGRHPDR